MNNSRLPALLVEIAQQDVPATLDRVSVIHSRYAGKRRPRHPRRFVGQPALAGIVLALILIPVGIPIAAPMAGAAMANLRRISGVVLVNPTPTLSPASARGPATPIGARVIAGTPQVVPHVSLAEAQRRVPFTIRLPTHLPPDVKFEGAVAPPAHATRVDLFWKQEAGASGTVHIVEADGRAPAVYAFPADRGQAVVINGHPGLYFKGSWQAGGQWDAGADAGTVSWEDNGYALMVQGSGLSMSRDELLQIAESIP